MQNVRDALHGGAHNHAIGNVSLMQSYSQDLRDRV